VTVTVRAVNDLNSISKKGSNWKKLTKIETYLNTKPKLKFIWKNLIKIEKKKYLNHKYKTVNPLIPYFIKIYIVQVILSCLVV